MTHEEAEPEAADSPPNPPTHYIGVGASAGGLEALQALLQNLPTDTGACFIVVQHLSPDFKSMMLELLSKHTSMEIYNVQDGVQVKPNAIYLIPPKKHMMVAQGQLLLSDKMPDSGLSRPIDIFFRSLSEDQQHKAIGIILSGTGSDGSRGIRALKEVGALVIAQEPESAKFDGMPRSAINTGVVDLILPPEEMGLKIESYIAHPLVSGDADSLKGSMTGNEDIMGEIFSVLKTKSEIDFAKYKPSTVARRIERRMTLKQVTSLQEYLTLMFKEPVEVQVLSKELLIGVTRFFRDDEAFENMRNKIIPGIVKSSSKDAPIRAWTAGCSTGEEAYSIAILFAEELAKQNVQRVVKVFATDVNADAISEASNGAYSDDIQHDVGAHYLAKYFAKTAIGGYQISKEIRQMVVFATHNMIVDPPFSNIDIVLCRNVLIYFQHSVQKRVLTSLHFSLKKDGYLFLGSSENLADLSPYFEVVNDRNRIYRKRGSARIPIGAEPPINSIPRAGAQAIPSVSRLMQGYRGANSATYPASFANEVLITHYVPPCILLNDAYEALHVFGDVSKYVRSLQPGRISVDVRDMVNEDISIAISSALQRAKQSEGEVYYTDVFTQHKDEAVGVNLRARYVKEHQTESSPGYFWLIFEGSTSNATNAATAGAVSFDASEQSRQRIGDLELELKRNKENLQVTVEELETTNEELQSANEELMSANEEMQSTNEELQSVNEELYSVNSEHQEKIAEISQANNDLDEVLSLSKIGIIFLDEDMLIRRYTPAASEYIHLMPTDINRPLHHLSLKIRYDEMMADVSEVFATDTAKEHEIVMADKKVLHISINTYQYSGELQSKGVALTFSDVSKMAYTEKAMSVAYNQLRNSVNNALELLDTEPFQEHVGVLVVDDEPTDLMLAANVLRRVKAFSATVFEASSVSTAVAQVRNNAVDLCLVDYHLAEETAIDLIEKFSRESINVPIVVITGDTALELNAMLLSHGALDLIDKSDLSAQLLSQSIRYAIRRRQIDDKINNAIATASDINKLMLEEAPT